jgi:hypothetical protein
MLIYCTLMTQTSPSSKTMSDISCNSEIRSQRYELEACRQSLAQVVAQVVFMASQKLKAKRRMQWQTKPHQIHNIRTALGTSRQLTTWRVFEWQAEAFFKLLVRVQACQRGNYCGSDWVSYNHQYIDNIHHHNLWFVFNVVFHHVWPFYIWNMHAQDYVQEPG